jgi:hypothetical protein
VSYTRARSDAAISRQGTFAIREPKQGKAVGAVVFPSPPGYEGYISLLDVATLTTAQYELVRSFLLRVLELDPATRGRLADRWRVPGPTIAPYVAGHDRPGDVPRVRRGRLSAPARHPFARVVGLGLEQPRALDSLSA